MIALLSNTEGSGTQESVTPGGALAAGAPEVYLAEVTSPHQKLRMLQTSVFGDPSRFAPFIVAMKLPSDFSSTPSTRIAILGRCLGPFEHVLDPLGATQVRDVPLSRIATYDCFSLWSTDAAIPFALVSNPYSIVEGSGTGGLSPAILIDGDRAGALQPFRTASPDDQDEGARDDATTIGTPRAFYTKGIFQSIPVNDPPPDVAPQNGYEWDVDSDGTVDLRTSQPFFQVHFDSETGIRTRGVCATIGVPESGENRAYRTRVTLTIRDANNNQIGRPITTTLILQLDTKQGLGTALSPRTDEALENDFGYSQYASLFDDSSEMGSDMRHRVGQLGLAPADFDRARLLYVGANSVVTPTGTAPLGETLFQVGLSGTGQDVRFDPTQTRAFGTVVFDKARDWDQEELESTIEHEKVHLAQIAELKTNPEYILGKIFAEWLRIRLAAGDDPATAYFRALMFVTEFAETEARLRELELSSEGRTSNLFVKDGPLAAFMGHMRIAKDLANDLTQNREGALDFLDAIYDRIPAGWKLITEPGNPLYLAPPRSND